MPKEIWNMGRVAGYSAYEIYVRQHQAEDPDTKPATERQWLASSLAMGSSLLLKIPEVTNVDDGEIHDIQVALPAGTRLCAANTIIGSFFLGDATVIEGSTWAQCVTDYGPLIRNTSSSYPTSPSNVPSDSKEDISETEIYQLQGYLSIIDGIVYQPGTWSEATKQPPKKDFKPDMSGVGTVRIRFKGKISESFWILLTGFTMRSVLVGETGLDGVVPSTEPQNGDFLGPQQFPWANKIIFTTPSAAIKYFNSIHVFERKLPESDDASKVTSQSIIDMNSVSLGNYYSSYHTYSPTSIDETITQFHTLGDSASILTIYQPNNLLPPALYGSTPNSTGTSTLYPIDSVVPGNPKIFDKAYLQKVSEDQSWTPQKLQSESQKLLDEASSWQDTHHNVSLFRDDQYLLQQIDIENYNNQIPVADVTLATGTRPYYFTATTGLKSIKGLSMANASGTLYSLDGDSGQITKQFDLTTDASGSTYTASVNWENFKDMLVNNQSLKLTLTIPPYNPNSYVDMDITEAFRQSSGNTPRVFFLQFRGVTEYLDIDPWDGTSTVESSPNDGYFRTVLRLYTTSAGTVSKFNMYIRVYLKAEHTLNAGSDPSNRFSGNGMFWRGDISTEAAQHVTGTPLFHKENDSIGYGGNASTALIYTWNSVPDSAGSEYDWLTSGRTIVADECNFNFGINLTIQGNGVVGDDNDIIRLIDRSYSYNTPASGTEITRLDTSLGGNSDAPSRTWNAGVMPSGSSSGSDSFSFTISGMFVSDGLTS